jgi:hypothetical protein
MAIYVYEDATGVLVSYCPDDADPVASAADLQAKGLVAVSGLPALDQTHAWDAATRSVIVVEAPRLPRYLSTGLYILRFTTEEFVAITTNQDPDVMRMMYALGHTTQVDLNDHVVIDGANMLVAKGLLAADRVAVVLA